jgi:PAS domain S-box-containing protein
MDPNADSIVQAVRQPLLVLDDEFRVAAANHSFYHSFELSAELTAGRQIHELHGGQWDTPVLRKLLADALHGDDESRNDEIEHDLPQVRRRTLLLNARRLHFGGNDAKLILVSFEDITERRATEVEVGRQRTWFQTTLASIGDAVIATDAQACVTYLNPKAEALTGWRQADAVGRPLREVFRIVNEGTRAPLECRVTQVIRECAAEEPPVHILLIAKDGSEHPIDDTAAPIRDGDGQIIGVVVVFHDVSARRRAEQLLQISEIRYRRLFEAAHDGILILDSTTRRITDVNPFMMMLLDYPSEYFIGKELWEIGIFRDKEANLSAMQGLQETGSVRYEDLPLQDRNGHRHPVEIVANVYQEDNERVIQCNIRDIAERVAFERERAALLANEQAARMEAEAANRSKDLFLATLSHEVRTPLNAILGWATILRSGRCDAADFQEGMEVIERNCKAQAQLIEDVLDISRIVSGKLQLQIRLCDLADVIRAAIDVVRPSADSKGVCLEVSLDSTTSQASCDKNRMQQVVWNLLSNAVKFTPRGGSVRVTLIRDGFCARIQVSDEGQGINPEFLPFVFDRFRQADSTTRRKLGGLGLGLSIVKHIVEVHGGTVSADSAGEGCGATFIVDLPIRAVHVDEGAGDPFAADVTPTPDAMSVRLDGLRVLIVDDAPDARRLLVKVLGEAGAVVIAASSVAEALEALATMNPQVLVSDIAMPGQDGFDLIRQVREMGLTFKELPAVALTAFAHKEDRRRVLRAGYQVHVTKPVDPHELVAVIAGLAGHGMKPNLVPK